MPGAEREAPEAPAGSSGTGALGHLPWQQIPKFTPGVTKVDEYVQRLKFLKELWPEEHLHLLGPRAALQVEGSAFQKISRLAPEKLRQPDGIKVLVETLGGSWGRTLTDKKYHFFEQAIYQVSQKNDETNDSYIARHDAFFEELLARNVTIEEVRAYILLRHSQLAPEEKKKVVVESNGDLKYAATVRAIRLLGSKFFGDLLQRGAGSAGSSRNVERGRVYDIHRTEGDAEEETYMTTEDEPSDEDILCYFLESHDEDAVFITEFEDQMIEAIQESELAPRVCHLSRSPTATAGESPIEGLLALKGPQQGRGGWQEGQSTDGPGILTGQRPQSHTCGPRSEFFMSLVWGAWTLEKGMSKTP